VQNSSKPFKSSGTWTDDVPKENLKEASGKYIGAFVNYETSENETIEVKVGISYTSIEQARLNLDTEIPGWNFDEIKENAEERWNNALRKIEIEVPEANDEAYNHRKKVTFTRRFIMRCFFLPLLAM